MDSESNLCKEKSVRRKKINKTAQARQGAGVRWIFQVCIDTMTAGEMLNLDIVVYGSRGNGETTLLNYFRTEQEKRQEEVDIIWITPNQIRTEDRFVKLIKNDISQLIWWERLVRIKRAAAGGVDVDFP